MSPSVGVPQTSFPTAGYSGTKGDKLSSVLLVDDDVDSLILLSYIFEQFPCSVVCETEGQAALNALQQNKFDLLMLDIQLPDMSGLEVVRRLRTQPNGASLPVIAVTALARPQDRNIILQAGCDRYISKPYLVEDLESLIGLYLNKTNR